MTYSQTESFISLAFFLDVENHFTYFSEIEEHFQRRRGTLLLLSTLDWALIESWKEASIPLEAVLRGIDATFDKRERRPKTSRKINGLAYCAQEVLAAAEDMKEAAVGTAREPKETGFEAAELAAYLLRNAEAFEKSQPPEGAHKLVEEDAVALRQLAESVQASTERPLTEDLERRLTVMEERLFAALLAATSDDALVAIRAQADRELAPYRSKMTGPQIEQLVKQYTNKKLLERYKLPRLSLFYL